MAEARQKEINDSMTVVATNTRTAGRLVSIEVLMPRRGVDRLTHKLFEDSIARSARAWVEGWDRRATLISLPGCQVRAGDTIMPTKRVLIEQAPCETQAERDS